MKFEDIVSIFKGDFLLVAVAPQKTDSPQMGRPHVYLGATISNPESLHKLMAELKKAKDSSGDQPGKNRFDKFKSAYNASENILGISGTQELAEAFVNSEEKTITDLLPDKIKTNPLNFVVDFRALSNLLENATGEVSPKLKPFTGFVGILDKLIMTRSGYANGIAEGHFEIVMANHSENSLRTLVRVLDKTK